MFKSWCFRLMPKKKKSLLKICDELWSKLVKIRAGFRCEYCWKTSWLNSHHIRSRTNYSTRYNLDNWICLCQAHHTLSSQFSAHKTPIEFIEWIKEQRWEERYDNLKLESNKIRDKNYKKVEQYLLEETEKLTT